LPKLSSSGLLPHEPPSFPAASSTVSRTSHFHNSQSSLSHTQFAHIGELQACMLKASCAHIHFQVHGWHSMTEWHHTILQYNALSIFGGGGGGSKRICAALACPLQQDHSIDCLQSLVNSLHSNPSCRECGFCNMWITQPSSRTTQNEIVPLTTGNDQNLYYSNFSSVPHITINLSNIHRKRKAEMRKKNPPLRSLHNVTHPIWPLVWLRLHLV
jgi:hypothetical protein